MSRQIFKLFVALLGLATVNLPMDAARRQNKVKKRCDEALSYLVTSVKQKKTQKRLIAAAACSVATGALIFMGSGLLSTDNEPEIKQPSFKGSLTKEDVIAIIGKIEGSNKEMISLIDPFHAKINTLLSDSSTISIALALVFLVVESRLQGLLLSHDFAFRRKLGLGEKINDELKAQALNCVNQLKSIVELCRNSDLSVFKAFELRHLFYTHCYQEKTVGDDASKKHFEEQLRMKPLALEQKVEQFEVSKYSETVASLLQEINNQQRKNADVFLGRVIDSLYPGRQYID